MLIIQNEMAQRSKFRIYGAASKVSDSRFVLTKLIEHLPSSPILAKIKSPIFVTKFSLILANKRFQSKIKYR